MVNRILGILGWLGTALALAAFAVYIFRPEWSTYARWAAWAGLACVLLYMLGQWREIVTFFARRQARLGTIAFASILVVAGILVAINYISYRENKRWDLTANKQFTLAEQTQKVLGGLDTPLKISVFARENEFARYRDRLGEYEDASKQVSVEYVDPDRRPALARQFQVQTYGTLVLEYKGRVERVTNDSEQDVTNGIIKVVTGQERRVYFVQGHGEKDTGSSEPGGYSTVATALGRDNYQYEKLVLAQQGDVPADASVVVVAGPKVELLAPEVDALRRYLARGGKLLVLIDPPDDAASPQLTSVTALLKEWGIEVGNNIVVDASGVGRLLGMGPEVPVAASYPSHPITDRFNVLTAFPLARSVTPMSGGVSGRYAQSFVETSPRSWAETDVEKLLKTGQVENEAARGDKQGPVSIAAAVSATAENAPAPAGDRKPETRLAVVGDSDFASNNTVGVSGNRDLFLNCISWLAQQESLIAIRPREPDDRRVTLTAGQQRFVFWLSIAVVPGLIIGMGILTWWRRR